MSTASSGVLNLGKERLEASTDGGDLLHSNECTSAELSVPAIAIGATSAAAATSIEVLAPNLMGYVLSFLLLAQWDTKKSVALQGYPSLGLVP